jgi:D-glycero-D-manno-heptose 1,7-bisphosphate phosphatase
MTNALHRAVFLDRDGVINRNRADHVKSWAEFEFLPGALASLRRLAQLPWAVVVVSNQAIIGRGLVPASGCGRDP